MRRILFCVLALAVLTGCEAKRDTDSSEQPDKTKAKATIKVDPQVAKSIERAQREAAFAPVWTKFLEDAKRQDEFEPSSTKTAFDKLDDAQKKKAQEMMDFPLVMRAHTEELTEMGFRAWLARRSRAEAIEDEGFKTLAQTLWASKRLPPGGLMGLANRWGFLQGTEQALVIQVVNGEHKEADLKPEDKTIVTKFLGKDFFKK